MDPRAGMDALEKKDFLNVPGVELRPREVSSGPWPAAVAGGCPCAYTEGTRCGPVRRQSMYGSLWSRACDGPVRSGPFMVTSSHAMRQGLVTGSSVLPGTLLVSVV
jgi:hypothetical protein